MSAVAVLPRILGSLLYYSPVTPQAQQIMPQIAELPTLLDWQHSDIIAVATEKLTTRLPELVPVCSLEPLSNDAESLSATFAKLFEGSDHLDAPPWGSVYLTEENLIMGESMLAYCEFLASQGLAVDTEMNEPSDHFGLMMFALAYFMESENDEAVQTLLSVYLLPWAPRYLALLQVADDSGFYESLAIIANEFLTEVAEAYEVKAVPCHLYL